MSYIFLILAYIQGGYIIEYLVWVFCNSATFSVTFRYNSCIFVFLYSSLRIQCSLSYNIILFLISYITYWSSV